MDKKNYLKADEIGIMEYINLIIKRKNLVLSVFMISLIFGVMTTILTVKPKVYEISADIQLGRIYDLLINKNEAMKIITSNNLLLTVIQKSGMKIDVESLKDAIKVEDIVGTDLVDIKIIYSDLDAGLMILKNIASGFILQEQPFYEKNISLMQGRLNELDSDINNASAGLNVVRRNLKELDVLEGNLAYLKYLRELKNEKNMLGSVLINSKNFQLSDLSFKLKNYAKPNLKLNLFLSAITGLILGAFLALFFEYWHNYDSFK